MRKPIPSTWTFSLWLTFQQRRTDAIGSLARLMASDPVWPGLLGLSGLQDYLTKHGASADTLTALQEAWQEWQTGRTPTSEKE